MTYTQLIQSIKDGNVITWLDWKGRHYKIGIRRETVSVAQIRRLEKEHKAKIVRDSKTAATGIVKIKIKDNEKQAKQKRSRKSKQLLPSKSR